MYIYAQLRMYMRKCRKHKKCWSSIRHLAYALIEQEQVLAIPCKDRMI